MRYVARLYHLLKKGWLRKWRVWRGLPPRSTAPPPVELFDSIKNLVMDKWNDIHETNNPFILLKSGSEKTNKIWSYCSDTWDDIRNQHIRKFGISFEYSQYLAKQAEAAELKIENAEAPSKWNIMLLEFAEEELQALTPKENHDSTKEKSIIQLGLKMNFIDNAKTSVDQYYTWADLYKNMVANGK